MPDDPTDPPDDLPPPSGDYAPPAEDPDPLDLGPDPLPQEMVTVAEVIAYVLTGAARKELEKAVKKRMPMREVDDLIQETIHAATVARRRPRTVDAIPKWVHGIAGRKIAHYYAKRANQDRLMADYLERKHKTPPPASQVGEDELMVSWLKGAVANDAHDAETLDIVADHAMNGKSYAEIARERRLDVKTIDNRIGYFKAKYAPLRKRYRQRIAWLTVLAVLLIAGVAYAAYVLRERLLGDVPGSVAPPKAIETAAPPPPAPTASVFMPAEKPPKRAPSDDRKTR